MSHPDRVAFLVGLGIGALASPFIFWYYFVKGVLPW